MREEDSIMKCIQSFLISSVLLIVYTVLLLLVVSAVNKVVPIFNSAGVNFVVSLLAIIFSVKLTQWTMEKWLAKRLVCRR